MRYKDHCVGFIITGKGVVFTRKVNKHKINVFTHKMTDINGVEHLVFTTKPVTRQACPVNYQEAIRYNALNQWYIHASGINSQKEI